MKIVITDCSWGSYDVEKQYLPKDAEVVCKQILTEEDVYKRQLLGSVAGVLLAFYLLLQGAYDLLTPLSLVIFLLLWALPVLLLSDWAGRY